MLGQLGHLFIAIAFGAILAATLAFFIGQKAYQENDRKSWLYFARSAFYVHGWAVLVAIGVLFSMLYFQHYEYEYAWKHASKELPLYFLISCFWEGQEGSFLLWIFWNIWIGWWLIRSAKNWEFSAMTVFCTIQLFLISMVLGSHLTADFRLGSSPFMLLKDVMDSDIYLANPDFVPQDGTGLNPLLQNIWMVIHPPVIFLGFALSGVPFALAAAALWQNQLSQFARKAAPWVLATLSILGVGIMMGAYWAYETLNFGGYWNWDPVENAVLIPWIVLLAALHGLVLYRRKSKGLGLTMALVMAGFLLVLYSTFLTRSGVLGESSVHAFTDLGLSGQLLLFLLFFVTVAVALFWFRRHDLRDMEPNASFLSLEFWMMTGICLLGLSAFQVLLPTSIPVFNVVLHSLGVSKKMAPPADQVAFYSQFQIWFAVGCCLLAALGQVFYWKKIRSGQDLEQAVFLPLVISLPLAAFIIYVGQTTTISYICLISAAIYLLVVSALLFISLVKRVEKISLGGLLAHVGLAVLLLGLVYSSGHKRILSQNLQLNAPDSGLPPHTVRKNLLLSQNVPVDNNGYQMVYKGMFYEVAQTGEKIPVAHCLDTSLPQQKILNKAIESPSGSRFAYGDTVEVNKENRYYAIKMREEGGRSFTIWPRMQNNPQMGYIASPDIHHQWTGDIYTHVTNFPDPEKVEWRTPITHILTPGQSVQVDGLEIRLDEVRAREGAAGIPYSPDDLTLEAQLTVMDGHAKYLARPIFHVDKHRSLRFFPDEIKALGAKVLLTSVQPETQQYGISVMTSQRNWITIESIAMPLASGVWLGTLLITLGMGLALVARVREAQSVQKKAPAEHTTDSRSIFIPNTIITQHTPMN